MRTVTLADIDIWRSEKQSLDLPQRERKPNIYHNRKANDLGRSLEILEWVAHPGTLQNTFLHSNRVPLIMPSSMNYNRLPKA